jgi:hypothetical protein
MVLLHGAATGCGAHRRLLGREPLGDADRLQAGLEPARMGALKRPQAASFFAVSALTIGATLVP